MFNIGRYLEKFSKNLKSSEEDKEIIAEVIKKHTDIGVLFENMEIKNNILSLNISPAQKNTVFIYKQTILNNLERKTSEKIVNIK